MNNWRMFFQFVFPSVIAFALSRIYTIVDGFFVGRSLGDMGLAAINLGFSISAFMQAVGTGIGLLQIQTVLLKRKISLLSTQLRLRKNNERYNCSC